MDTDSSNVVSNNVIGSNSQVSITQNIVHTQTCAINPIPHQLPLAPDLFDRIDIRDSLIYSINSGKRIFLFYGAPGVGKTYCLTKYANEVADRFSDGHIFVDLNDYRALDGSLNVDDLYKFVIRSLTKDCPSNPSDIKSYFRSVTYGKKILLVLDNVTDSFDIDSLVLNSDECLLLSAGNCKEACASYLHRFKSIPVNSFDSSTSVSYFRNQLEECDRIDFDSLENDPLFHKLVSVCDGLPILLSRAAHLIRDNVYTLEDIVSNLSNPEVEPLMGALNLETAHLDDFSSSLYSLLGRIGGGPIALSSLTCISNMKAAVAALQGKSLIELSSTAWLASCSSFESRPLISMNRQISNYAKTYKFMESRTEDAEDSRNVMVKILVPGSDETRNRVILATNNQTQVKKTSLRATDQIHIQIELYMKRNGLYYERRKNYYKNQGRKREEIVTLSFLAQCMMSILLGRPDQARARPSTLLSDEVQYKKIFGQDGNLEAYYRAASLGKQVCLKFPQIKRDLEGSQISVIRFYVIMGVASMLSNKDSLTFGDIENLDLDKLSDEIIQTVADMVMDVYLALGGTSKAAKSYAMASKVKEKISLLLP